MRTELNNFMIPPPEWEKIAVSVSCVQHSPYLKTKS